MRMQEKLGGQPLVVLLLVLGCWMAIRVVTWQPSELTLDLLVATGGADGTQVAQQSAPVPLGATPYTPAFLSLPYPSLAYAMPAFRWGQAAYVPPPVGPMPWTTLPSMPAPGGYPSAQPPYPVPAPAAAQPVGYAGHAGSSFFWPGANVGGGMPGIELPPRHAALSMPEAPAPIPLSPGLAEGKADRWSADAWMLVRKEGRASFSGGRPIYGGSQAGAVLRYHIAPSSAHRPLAYLRTSQATGRIPESEVALGVGARPLAALPVMLAAEARAFRSASKTRFRPTVLAYTELPPFAMPLGLQGEAYLQGGYVGGDFKTGFVDGQLRVDRRFLSIAGNDLRLGAGIWGGAQRGAKRLDIGPGASAAIDLMGTPSRLSLDWRFRVLGDAEPDTGPALTLSAGF